jgi:hypothetical protein
MKRVPLPMYCSTPSLTIDLMFGLKTSSISSRCFALTLTPWLLPDDDLRMMTSFKVVFDFATQTYPGLNWLPQGVITKINEKKDSLSI